MIVSRIEEINLGGLFWSLKWQSAKEASVNGEKRKIEQFKPHLMATLGERDSGRLKGEREEEI